MDSADSKQTPLHCAESDELHNLYSFVPAESQAVFLELHAFAHKTLGLSGFEMPTSVPPIDLHSP